MAKTYLEHILKTGSAEDRQAIIKCIETKLVLKNRQLIKA
jgi:hypothetical protein